MSIRHSLELEATTVEKYAAVEAFLDEHGRRIWAATESRAIGYRGDALVSNATEFSRPTIRKGRRELESGGMERGRIRIADAGRPRIEQSRPGIKKAFEMSGVTTTPPAFVVASLRPWWNEMGKRRYPEAGELFITADASGSNGYRSRA